MPTSDAYDPSAPISAQDFSPNGGPSLGWFSGNGGLTANHAAFILIVVGLAGLWFVARTFKGA